MATVPNHHRFNVYEYHQMGDAGIFTEDDRVELIDGEVIEMFPRSPDGTAVAAEPAPYRFNVSEYHRMAEAEILGEDDRVELIDGSIVQMSPIGWPHANCVDLLTRLLVLHFRDDAIVRIQNPIRLGEHDEPQPDVTVVRKRAYVGSLPVADDLILLIEVSDTSLRDDRRSKLPLYARSGIAECWLVDLQGEAIERHTNPVGDRYHTSVRAERGHQIESLAVPGLILKTDEVLGEPQS